MRKEKQPLNFCTTVTAEVGAWINAELERRGQVGRRGAAAALVSELLSDAVRARKTAGASSVASAPVPMADDDDAVDFDRSKL